ncbi:unnamed protein product [Dovyalis caffra]|uniref:Uncharacterized protein n=1 Tax=Dovyalis caffra TaxID=77055 RepID=A0AAV1S634_9ROSI|nr:unnamed protein product [Dovyalis caffra]
MEDSYNVVHSRYMLEVNIDDVIIEENALYVNRSHNECDNLMGKVFKNKEEAYNFYNEYAIRTGFGSQGNVKTREIVQDGLKKIDKDIENELAKLSISLDGQEMENEADDGQNVEETLDVNPILNPLVQRPKASLMQDSKDT